MPNQYTQQGVCPECGERIPGHRLTCPTLLSPEAREKYLIVVTKRRKAAKEKRGKK